MSKQEYMEKIRYYLQRQLVQGSVSVRELPVDWNNCFRLTLWERFKVLVGLMPEHFPVRIDWSYRGNHYNTVYTGPADKACLEPLAAKLYSMYIKQEGRE